MSMLDFYTSQFSRLPAAPKGDLLSGQTVVLTGGNSGIGLEVAHHVTALQPARLILAVRDPTTATEQFEKVVQQAPSGVEVDLWKLDLAEFDSVKAFAKQCESLERVDVLLLNAARFPGVHKAPMQKTVDGHDRIHQINVLSHLLLLCLLQPLLVKAASPRVVFTTSEVFTWAPTGPIAEIVQKQGSIIDYVNDEKYYDNNPRYFFSKLLLQMAIRAIIPWPPFKIVSVNPGLCRSKLWKGLEVSSLTNFAIDAWLYTIGRSAETGARNVTHAIFAKDSHEYWGDCVPKACPSPFLASKLGMQASEQYWQEVKDLLEGVTPGCTKWSEQ